MARRNLHPTHLNLLRPLGYLNSSSGSQRPNAPANQESDIFVYLVLCIFGEFTLLPPPHVPHPAIGAPGPYTPQIIHHESSRWTEVFGPYLHRDRAIATADEVFRRYEKDNPDRRFEIYPGPATGPQSPWFLAIWFDRNNRFDWRCEVKVKRTRVDNETRQ